MFIHINQLINFFLFRIQIKGAELVVKGGLLSKSKTIVPINRVQSVHLVENYLHNLTNTCAIKVETAGSDSTEIEVAAINKEKALSLQELLQNAVIKADPNNDTVQLQIMGIRFRDVIKLAISENHIRTFLIILAFTYSRVEDVKQLFGYDPSNIINEQVDQVAFSTSNILTLFMAGLFITLLVSLIRVLLRYHEMTIKSNSKGFQMEWGFLQTQQKMLIQNKVQLISWNNNFLRKILGIQIIRFFMIGEDINLTKQHIQLPVMQSSLLYQLVSPYQTIWPSSNETAHCVHHSYGWRNTILFILPITGAISVPIFVWDPLYILLPFLVLLYLSISNWVKYRKFKYWYNESSIQIQKGIWGEENILLNFNKVQQVLVKTSPFLRRKKLATIELHTAGETIILPFIPLEQAQYIADWALLCIEFKLTENGKIALKQMES